MNCQGLKFLVSAGVCLLPIVSAAQNPTVQPGESPPIQLQPNVSVAEPVDEASLAQKSSYIIGFNMVLDLQNQGLDVDLNKMIEGMQTAIKGGELGMTDEEVNSVITAYQKVVAKRQIEKMKQAAEQNRAAGDKFLAEFAKKEGVKQLPNGVEYEVITATEGESPSVDDQVRIHYHGTLPNGDVFDSSLTGPNGLPGKPVTFPVGQVVPGFSAALQAMKVGEKWKVVIPGDLAYGARGQGEIGPNQTLVFDIELLEIVK